jgi:hypothetical protein
MSKTREMSEKSKMSKTSEMSETSKTSKTSETSERSKMSEMSETSNFFFFRLIQRMFWMQKKLLFHLPYSTS